jgi:hypothetical protein
MKSESPEQFIGSLRPLCQQLVSMERIEAGRGVAGRAERRTGGRRARDGLGESA